MPDEKKSCLSPSVALVFEQDMRKATAIRQSILPRADRTVPSHSYSMVVVAEAIRVDSEAWSDAILGYDCIFLAAPTCLAPATARARAARYSSIPAHTTMPWCSLRSPDAPQEFCAGAVPAISAGGGRVFDTLRALAMELRAKRAYANTTTFDLSRKVSGIFSRLFIRESSSWRMDVCWHQVCRQGLKCEKEARAHRSTLGMSSLANTDILYSDSMLHRTLYRGNDCSSNTGRHHVIYTIHVQCVGEDRFLCPKLCFI